MSDTVIHAEGLGKRYRIGPREPYRALRDTLMDVARAPWRVLSGNGAQANSFLWALKDVSFEIKQGEAIGIIGRNGAGKSTLLKVLSRITEPTAGRVRLRGRVGALLEVGTGFHPELSGRENVFLNGAILGMKHAEIVRKFDEIVAFAEVAEFLDLPVKRYSSGMFMRLAFAVAAHLEPEILVVDEVLAVGDSHFQRKCLGKMSDVAQQGRTVLFVSHNMGAINRLCQRVLWIHEGHLHRAGPANEVVAEYLSSHQDESGQRQWPEGIALPGVTEFRLNSVRVLQDGKVTPLLDCRYAFSIEAAYEVLQTITRARVAFCIYTADGWLVCETCDSDNDANFGQRSPGRYVSRVTIPGGLLNPGNYSITTYAGMPFVKILMRAEHILGIRVEDTLNIGAHFNMRRDGVICPRFEWEIRDERGERAVFAKDEQSR